MSPPFILCAPMYVTISSPLNVQYQPQSSYSTPRDPQILRLLDCLSSDMQASRPAFPFSKYCSVVCIFLTPSPTPNEPRASGSSRQGWQKKFHKKYYYKNFLKLVYSPLYHMFINSSCSLFGFRFLQEWHKRCIISQLNVNSHFLLAVAWDPFVFSFFLSVCYPDHTSSVSSTRHARDHWQVFSVQIS